MLSFLSPLFLIGSMAAAVPIVLHLLRREPEPRVRFAAVKLLRGAPVEYTDRRRLRELLLLALRVAARVLLAIAFARPFSPVARASGQADAIVVALDTSASMSAPGAFARARQLAAAAIDRTPAAGLAGVVTFADAPAMAAPLGPDRALARAAIAAASPGFGATRYRGALGAAVQALGGRRGTIVVVTDLQESGWDAGDRAPIPEGVTVEIADVGAVRVNLAVTALRTIGDRVVASVRNDGDDIRETRVRLSLDGRAAGETPASVAPHATAEVEFAGAAKASTAVVTVDDSGGIAADDTRYALLDSASRPSLLVVTSNGDMGLDAFYLQQALMAGSASGRLYRIAAARPAQLGTKDAALAANAAVVLLSSRGLEKRGREALAAYVQDGGGVLVAAGADIDGEVAADILGRDAALRIAAIVEAAPIERSLVPVDARHPVFQSFGAQLATLGLIRFRRVARIDGGSCQTIARLTTGEAALLSCDAGAGRALVFASDLDNRWNDFPLHPTFVPFIQESLAYLAGSRSTGQQVLVADVPRDVAPKPGFAEVLGAGGKNESRRIAVNVDPRESDLSRLSTGDFQGAIAYLKDAGRVEARAQASGREDSQHLWLYALMLTIAALAAESLVA